MKKNLLFLLLLGALLFQDVQAQNFGAHPYGLNWQVMKSPAGNVIFPKGMEDKARRVSNIINYMNDSCTQSVGNKFKKINLVLQNQTVIPNGYVGLAPFRSEFYTTPPEGIDILGSIDWIDGLAIHEYRHVLQYRNADRGFTKFWHLFQGQYGWDVASNLSLPNWYWEGDAVITETALSNSGRGRTPSFSIEQRSLALAGIDYRYMKLRNGSFKSMLPNHYPLGYMMLTHLRNEKGNDVIKDILADAARYKKVFYPFSGALHKHTGYRTPSLYKASWEASKKQWKEELSKFILTPTIPFTQKQKKIVTNYYFPQVDRNGNVIALKSSYTKTGAIYRITDKGEKELVSIGFNLGSYFYYRNEKVVWTELSLNPRRTNVSYSDIYLYDIEKEKKIKLTKKGKYFSPAIANDGKTVVAVYVNEFQQCTLKRIDINTGEKKEDIPFAADEFVARPSFTNDDKAIVYILQKKNQLAVYKYDLSTNAKIQLTPWTAHSIDAPRVQGDYVYYTATFSGIDNIYRTPINGSMAIQQLTSVPIGAYEPSISWNSDTLLFTEFTEMGYVISKMEMKNKVSQNEESITLKEPVEMPWLDTVAYKAEGGNILNKIPDNKYEVKSYNLLFKDLTPHSWFFSTSPTETRFDIQMDNFLNDVKLIVGGGYNRNINGYFHTEELSIGRWYPVIKLKTRQSEGAGNYLNNNRPEQLSLKENDFSLAVSLPYQWLKGNYATHLMVEMSGTAYRQTIKHQLSPDRIIITANGINTSTYYSNDFFNSIEGTLYYSTLKRTAKQNVGSRMGAAGSLEYFRGIKKSDNEKIRGVGSVYLPGIGVNHNLKFLFAFQKELLRNRFQYSDNFEYPRGYSPFINDEVEKLSIDYGLPIAYPDWGFGGITYFKRIRANLFYDYGQSKFYLLNKTTKYESTGIELLFDNTFFNAAPVSFGFRGTYLLRKHPNTKEKNTISFFIASLF